MICALFSQASSDDQQNVSQLLQQLQEVRDETSATKEQMESYKESCSRLQDDLCVCAFKRLLWVNSY